MQAFNHLIVPLFLTNRTTKNVSICAQVQLLKPAQTYTITAIFVFLLKEERPTGIQRGAHPYFDLYEPTWAIHTIKAILITWRARTLAVLDIGPTVSSLLSPKG